MQEPTQCPKCHSESVYPEGQLWACAECSHEWDTSAAPLEAEATAVSDNLVVKDAHGNVLATGDAVTIIKDLKIKGSSSGVKVGTKIKNIRLIPAEDGHNIACKIEGVGAINLKSEFVKKA